MKGLPVENQERYLSSKEIAKRLNVSAVSVRKWLRQGKLKGVRAGKLWRVLESDLEAFLERDTKD
jgi:excisionase family DNA binding protein